MADAAVTGTDDRADEARALYLRWFRTVAIAFALVFIIFAVWSWWVTHFWPKASDFVSFWAAGRLALEGKASLAYDIAAHHTAEQAVGHVGGLLPFPYPPPFLAIVAFFALLPFGPSFFLWVLGTSAFYVWAARRVAQVPYALAVPAAYINLLIGQNGFLMSGIFITGLTLVEANPWLGGAILGLMVLKPQLALLLPVAMLAGREWRVIGAATLSASALLLLGLILFGGSTYRAFFEILPHYVQFMRDSRLPWSELASPFALARFAGLPEATALSIHSLIALVAVALTARAWWLRTEERVPILATSTMLIPPYFLTYDALLLIVPLGWMIARRRHPFAIAVTWLCALVPILNYYSSVAGPNLTSVAAIICLCVLQTDSRRNGTAAKFGGLRPIPVDVSPTS